MPDKNHPRRGSLAHKPFTRAPRLYPSITNAPRLPGNDAPLVLGFAAYKAGMTRVLMRDDNQGSPTEGQEVAKPVTVLEAPPLQVFGVRAYSENQPRGDTFADNMSNTLERVMHTPNSGTGDLDDITDDADSLRLLVHTQPRETGLQKKTPEVFELPLAGAVEDQITEAEDRLGTAIPISDVFQEGQFLDVISITQGKGTEGPVKRHGVKKQEHKAEKGRRKPGNYGPFQPRHTRWTVPMAGKKGVHRRTEYNKRFFTVADPEDVNPDGGLKNYGEPRSTCILVHGSVPGPTKRLVMLRNAARSQNQSIQTPDINYVLT